MIEILIALFMAFGCSPEELSQIQIGLGGFENPEGIGSTVNGTTTVIIDGSVWVISIDAKGNYIIYKQ